MLLVPSFQHLWSTITQKIFHFPKLFSFTPSLSPASSPPLQATHNTNNLSPLSSVHGYLFPVVDTQFFSHLPPINSMFSLWSSGCTLGTSLVSIVSCPACVRCNQTTEVDCFSNVRLCLDRSRVNLSQHSYEFSVLHLLG